MSKAAWAAIIAAIAFPTIALVVVILAGPRHHPAPPPPGPHPGQAAAQHEPPGPPHKLHPEMLLRHRKELELTDEQVDRIWDIVEPAHRRLVEIQAEVEEKEREVHALLESDDPDEKAVEKLVEELSGLHAERAKLEVLTPLRVRKILTPEQKTKLVEMWKQGSGTRPRPDLKRGPHQGGPGILHPPHKAPIHPPPHGKAPPAPPTAGGQPQPKIPAFE
jgi:Spy/CpxP family protein refolding chaperone